MNKLKLTDADDVNEMFFEGKTNYRLRSGILLTPSDKDWQNYIQIGIRYFVLKHTLISIIKKIYKEIVPRLYSDKRVEHIMKSLKRKGQDPVRSYFARYLIKDWALYLDLSILSYPDKRFPSKEFALVDYMDAIDFDALGQWLMLEPDATEIYGKIAKELKLKKSSVKILSYTKYGK